MNFKDELTLGEMMSILPSDPGSVGLDLEADSLYRHKERICLVQVCFGEEVVLLDPFGEESLQPFIETLKSAKIWMHGADYDMSLMLGEWGFVPPVLFDTQIAAQLLGYQRFGYASLVEECFQVELSKSSQKADWGKRPLSDKMLEYARNDVRYLLPLAQKLEKDLKEKGRYEWFLESCEAAQSRVIKRESTEKEHWRINGCGKLKPSGLAFLRELWRWRDKEAEAWNKPSFMVATNKALILWAEQLSQGQNIRFPQKIHPQRLKSLRAAIARGTVIPEKDWPAKPKRERYPKDDTFEARMKEALIVRNKAAEELAIDPALIASRPILEQIVGKRVQSEEVLQNWQRGLLKM